MNPRIQELARQAGWCIVDDDEQSTYFGRFAERFAELIVRECVGIADHSNVTGNSIIGERIKEHFGVER